VSAPADPFLILAVCTGNICRSPMTERLLLAKLGSVFPDDRPSIQVASAGTGALVGSPIEPSAAHCLQERGVDPSGFAARDLDVSMVRRAGLVLTATRDHRAATVRLMPAASRRIFTLLEFARLARLATPTTPPGGTATERLQGLVEAAAGNRGQQFTEHPSTDDIPDPYGRSQREFEAVAASIEAAVDVIIGSLEPGGDATAAVQ
jgi:protein-tyrosine phosphatase